jgi:hypothetical protein
MLLTHVDSGDFSETDALIREMLDAHRMKYQEIVQHQLELLSFLGDTPEGPVL